MYAAFVKLLNMSAASGILIAAVIALRFFLRKAPKKYICLLWAIAALRLCCPVSISSVVSAYNYIGRQSQTGSRMEYVQYNGRSEKPMGQLPVFTIADLAEDPAAKEPTQPDFYLPTAMGIWASGTASMLGYAAVSVLRVRKRTREAVRVSGNIYLCDHLPSPFIMGVVRPKIYVPSGLNDRQRQSVIAHERAHIHRLDHWWKPMGFVILSVHWFNPLVWVAYALLSRDIESACDERVIEKMTNKQKQEYSETLLQCSMPQKVISACPLAFGETGVKQRIKGILSYRKPAAWVAVFSLLICLFAGTVFLTDPVQAETAGSASPRYELQIGAHDVVRIVIAYPGGNGVCANADGSAFRLGENIWLEPLDNVPSLKDVTISAYTADMEQPIWNLMVRQDIVDGELVFDNGWALHIENGLPQTALGPRTISNDAITFTLPEQFLFYQTPGASAASIFDGAQLVGGLTTYPIGSEQLTADMDWIKTLPFPEWEMSDIGYMAGGAIGGDVTIEFFSDVPPGQEATVQNVHNLFYYDWTYYDLWFDTLHMDAEMQKEILSSVQVTASFCWFEEGERELRSSPGDDARVVGTLQAREQFLIRQYQTVADQQWVYGTNQDQTANGWLKLDGTEQMNIEPEQPTVTPTETPAEAAGHIVYISPTEGSRKVGTIAKDDDFIIQRAEMIGPRQWGYIVSQNDAITGWILLDELAQPAEKAEPEVYTTRLDGVVVYSSPSKSARVVGTVPAGEDLEVMREEMIGNTLWLYVSSESQSLIGWICTAEDNAVESVSGEFSFSVIVGNKPMNIRSGPGVGYSSVGMLQSGSEATVLEVVTSDGQQWGRIGPDQWIALAFTTK